MTRDEAQITAGAECKEFRPLSLGTMAILQQMHNATLAALLGGGGLTVNYEDFIIFLFVHARENTLGQVKAYMLDGSLIQKAYDWVEGADPLTIAAGVDYFTLTQERAALVAAGNAKNTEKKNAAATPEPLTHLRALMAHYLHYDLDTIDAIPYPQILQYLHSIMIINGNETRWLAVDKATAEKDTEFIQSLDI